MDAVDTYINTQEWQGQGSTFHFHILLSLLQLGQTLGYT